jgi:hypothetical protein
MATKIQFRRGLKANLPVLSSGEPALTTDTLEVYVGTPSGNLLIKPSLNTISAFRAYQTDVQSIPAGVLTKILFNTIEYDNRGEFNITSSKFEPVEAGMYYIQATVTWPLGQPDGNRTVLSIYVNGVEHTRLAASVTGGAKSTVSAGSTILKLNQSDDVEVYAMTENATTLQLGNGLTYFSAVKIG